MAAWRATGKDPVVARCPLVSLEELEPAQQTFVFMGIEISPIRPGWSGLIKGGHSGAEPDQLSE